MLAPSQSAIQKFLVHSLLSRRYAFFKPFSSLSTLVIESSAPSFRAQRWPHPCWTMPLYLGNWAKTRVITNNKCPSRLLPGAISISEINPLGGRSIMCCASLRVYTKSGCPLCDGIIEKLHDARRKGAFLGGFWASTTVKVHRS